MAHVTDHAKQRTKERLGLSKRLAEKNAEKALREGIRHKDTTGGLHRYVESLYWRHKTANNIRIYCNYVYIFSYSLLITVFALPQKYRKTAEKLRKRLKMKERKKIIAVDFDGTLFEQMEEKDWPTPGAPRQAVIDYVLEQQRQGARLILWTNRTGRPLGIAVQKCHEYGIEFDAINANLPEMIEKYDNDCRKIFADEYIDDRAIPMPGSALTVSEMVREAHANAAKHGFWDDPPELGTSIALIHSELSEALEEIRQGNPEMWYMKHGTIGGEPAEKMEVGLPKDGEKPEGFITELADAVIRIADLCGYLGIDLAPVIRAKMEYNATRPYKHGKQF